MAVGTELFPGADQTELVFLFSLLFNVTGSAGTDAHGTVQPGEVLFFSVTSGTEATLVEVSQGEVCRLSCAFFLLLRWMSCLWLFLRAHQRGLSHFEDIRLRGDEEQEKQNGQHRQHRESARPQRSHGGVACLPASGCPVLLPHGMPFHSFCLRRRNPKCLELETTLDSFSCAKGRQQNKGQ